MGNKSVVPVVRAGVDAFLVHQRQKEQGAGVTEHIKAVWSAFSRGLNFTPDSACPIFKKLAGQDFTTQDIEHYMSSELSKLAYHVGSAIVDIEDKMNGGAAAYLQKEPSPGEDEKPFTYKKGKATLLTPVDEFKKKGDHDRIHVRLCDGAMDLWIKKRHMTLSRSLPDTVSDIKGAVETLLNNASTELRAAEIEVKVKRATALITGTLRVSVALTILEFSTAGEGKKTVMFLAWAGTDVQKRVMDVFTDFSAVPVACREWNGSLPELFAHSGILGQVQHGFIKFEELVKDHLKEFGCTKLIFTGHSLGGGCALLAHMIALHCEVPGVECRSIVFEAPMVFYDASDRKWPRADFTQTVEGLSDNEKRLLEFHNNSTNYIVGHDVVPRLPGHPDYFKPCILEIVEGFLLNQAPGLATPMVVDEVKKLRDLYLDADALEATFSELQGFMHLSTLLYFPLSSSDPGTIDPPRYIRNKELLDEGFCKIEDSVGHLRHQYLIHCHLILPNAMKLKLAPS